MGMRAWGKGIIGKRLIGKRLVGMGIVGMRAWGNGPLTISPGGACRLALGLLIFLRCELVRHHPFSCKEYGIYLPMWDSLYLFSRKRINKDSEYPILRINKILTKVGRFLFFNPCFTHF